jgi:hypothetical protein
MTNLAANIEADALAALVDGGYLRIYNGTQPDNADDAITTQVKLAELRFGTPAFGAAVNGMITANAITPDSSAAAPGIATWFRIFQADGSTPVWDGNVGTIGSGADLELNSVNFSIGIEVSIGSFSHTVTK